LKRFIAQLLFGIILSLVIQQTVFAHAGVDHSKNCFLTVGDTRLRVSGYQFQPELEGKASAPAYVPYLHPVGKHFCHFFPELGQIVLALEPMTEGQGKFSVTLELAAFSLRSDFDQAFTVIKQQPAQLINGGISIFAPIQQRGIYRLNVMLQEGSVAKLQQHFIFLVGIPVTKIMVLIATVLLLLLGCIGIMIRSSITQR
jgi:hypothetical protein